MQHQLKSHKKRKKANSKLAFKHSVEVLSNDWKNNTLLINLFIKEDNVLNEEAYSYLNKLIGL